MTIRFTVTLALFSLGFGATAQDVAHVREVSADEIMDAALDMRRAAEQADKLGADGAKYCNWSVASLDASDLDAAISRFLLNHGSRVPETIPASKVWRVSFVAGDMVHQLAMA